METKTVHIVARADSEDSATNYNLKFRCGDCLHFKGNAHPSIGAPCESSGVVATGLAPACFTPDVGVLKKLPEPSIGILFSIFSSLTPKQSRILAGLLSKSSGLEKHGFSFLEKVYFCAGDDWLENYFCGHVISDDPHGNILIVGTKFFTELKTNMIASMRSKSLLNKKQFAEKKAALFESGKIIQDKRKPKIRPSVDIDYEPPTIESNPDSVGKVSAKPKKVNRKIDKNGQASVLTITDSSDTTSKPPRKKEEVREESQDVAPWENSSSDDDAGEMDE